MRKKYSTNALSLLFWLLCYAAHSSLSVPHCISNVTVSGKLVKFGYYTAAAAAAARSKQQSPLRSRLKGQSQQQQQLSEQPKPKPARPTTLSTKRTTRTKEQPDTVAKHGFITVSTTRCQSWQYQTFSTNVEL
jgi:hypothetical protein